jgi:hypothetical protein
MMMGIDDRQIRFENGFARLSHDVSPLRRQLLSGENDRAPACGAQIRSSV